MENNQIDPRIIEGESPFIKAFFEDLKKSPDYPRLKDQPFSTPEARSSLISYLNMDVIETYLRKLKGASLAEADTFMSNGLEWVNGNVAYNENGVKNGDVRELIHLYVNLLGLLAGAPTIFMKIGALTMLSFAPTTTLSWVTP